MATAPQTAMEMPQGAAPNPFSDPNTMAVYDQLRQTMSPKEFGDEMLAGASQVDPEAMAQFRKDLSEIDLSPEELDMLNNMVDEILATPEQYAAVRAKYLEMGAPEELLPEQFDPQFFAAMNMAVDQLIAEPSGVQAFAQGGIAELKPIAKVIASYGRNGDTMLAHITPAEARMLRRRGGSGTINPSTGLPEFFLKKAFKSIGKAVKKFANSTVGKIVTTVALGFFLGPAAASFMGVGSAAGVAAVSGFVGGAGSTLLGGGNLKDALKAGAIGGLTAGATAGISGAVSGTNAFASGSYTGPTTIGGQVDKFTGMFKSPTFPQYTAEGALTDNATSNAAREAYAGELYKTNPEAFYNPNAAPSDALADFTPKKGSLIPDGQGGLKFPEGQTVGQTKLPGGQILTQNVPIEAPYDPATATRAVDFGYKPGGETSFMDKIKSGYNEYFSPSNIQAQGIPEAERAGAAARDAMLARTPTATPAMLDSAYQTAYKAAMPGIFSTYAPVTALGLGAIGLAGGFKATDAQPSAMRDELMKPVTQRIAEGGNQRNYYIQGLPGVKYDQYGAPIFGQYNPLPTFDTGLGIESLINPRGFSAGGSADKVFSINNFDQTAYLNAHPDVKEAIARGEFKNAYEHYTQFGKAEGRTAFDKADTDAKAATDRAATEAAQAANRKLVADAKAAKKAAGFTSAYQNINAGLSYDAPAGIAATSIAARQAAFKPTMDKFTQAQAANTATLAKPYTPTVVATPYNNTTGYTNVLNPVAPKINYDTTPELTAAQKAAADKLAADAAARTAAEKAAADAASKAAADKLAADKAAADKVIADKLAADRAAAEKAAADKAAAEKAAADAAARAAAAKAAADRTIFQGQSVATQNQQIMDYLKANPNATDQTLAQQMDYFGIKSPQVAQVVGMQDVSGGSVQNIDRRYEMAKAANAGNPFAVAAQNQANAVTGQSIRDYFAKNPGMTDAQIAGYMDKNFIDPAQMQYAFAGTPGAISSQDVLARYQTATKLPPMIAGSPQEQAAVAGGQALLNRTIAGQRTFIPDAQLPEGMMGTMGGSGYDPVTGRMDLGTAGGSGQYVTRAEEPKKLMNMGGIASLRSGGYPRRTGQINGPGTATSDSIPAMLSDGEFVMTAKAVRGAGKGDRRAGAKRMYALMNQLEKNAARG
jgi:hypothetical protein